MSKTKVTKKDLQDRAKSLNIDSDQSYQELREEIEIYECKWCGDEYLHDMWDGYCCDTCQVMYYNEYY